MIISFPFLAIPQTDTLALVNNVPITSADFVNRFELSVYPGKGIESNLHLEKQKFLYSMIAEKLLSNASSNLLNNYTEEENQLKDEVERMFLRDALYRKEIMSKVKVSEKELSKGLRFSIYVYIIDTFYFPDSSSSFKFYNFAEKARNNIYKLSDSLKVRHDTLGIGYGESTEEIENAFFDHETGFISIPAYTVDGWVIFKIISKTTNKKFTSLATNEKIEKVRNIIKERKENLLGYNYLLSVMKGIEVNVNYKIFRPLVYFIKNILATHRPTKFDSGYYLSQNEINYVKEKFPYDPKAPLLKFKNGELTLGYALDNLTGAGFAPKDTTLPEITVSLHSALKFIVQNYFLAKRAIELGLKNSNEVKYNTNMFLDAYRSSLLSNDIADTVTIKQEQINKFFEDHKDEVLKDVKLRLQIFSFDNIDDAARILNQLNDLVNPNEDTTGAIWISALQLGEIGAILTDLPNGKIYGPLFKGNNYTIFRVLDKQSLLDQNKIGNSIQAATDMFTNESKTEAVSKYVAELAQKQKVKIFENKLDDVKVTPIQMLTFRYIGFGGKIVAVPTLYPREEWIKYYNPKEQLP